MDEPTSGLDYKGQQELLHILKGLKAKGVTIILTFHEVNLFDSIVDRIFYLHDGSISESQEDEDKSVKLIEVNHLDISLVEQWTEIIRVEKNQETLYLYVDAVVLNQVLKKILELDGKIEIIQDM